MEDGKPISKSQIVPDDVQQLKLKNLDTGEEYIIGENDPDFEFDTFALCTTLNTEKNASIGQEQEEDVFSWLYNMIFGGKKSKPNVAQEEQKSHFTKLSSFKFRRELGKGAFGRVLLAEVKTDGKLFAIKIISKKNMRKSDQRQAKAERDILYSMAHANPHPFTTGLRFAFQSENNLYLGMEYLPGGNLRNLIMRFGCLPEEWVKFYSSELVLAVAHLHSINVLYRDIKPHNVMLDGRGHIILIDYGLSKQEVMDPMGAQSLVGTPDYSAPEVLKTGVYRIEAAEREKKGKKAKPPSVESGNVGYGKAADWWSVGVMIFEMLAGTPAFRGADLRQTYQKVLFADLSFSPAENFSAAARELLKGLLNRDPAKRLGSVSEQEIKDCEFFRDVNWKAVYARAKDGPWVPDPDELLRKSKGAKALRAEHVDECEDEMKKGASEDGSDDFDSSEVLHVRDSIITGNGKNKKDNNRLHDWSFVDENALMAAAANNHKSY